MNEPKAYRAPSSPVLHSHPPPLRTLDVRAEDVSAAWSWAVVLGAVALGLFGGAVGALLMLVATRHP